MSIYQRAPSLNPQPDAFLWNAPRYRQGFLSEIGLICASVTMHRNKQKSAEDSRPSPVTGDLGALTEYARNRIAHYAEKIAAKNRLPEIADTLETAGIGIFAEESSRPAPPPDVDAAGILWKRVWNRLHNLAKREARKRPDGGAINAESPIDGEALNYEARETQEFYRHHAISRELPTDATVEVLDNALAGLTEIERTIVKGVELDGRSQEDVGSDLGISQPTVHRYLERAKTKLAERILQSTE